MSGLTRPDSWLEVSISPDARSVINEASGAMSDWIDKSVAELSKKITTEIEDAAKALNEQMTQVSQQFTAKKNELQTIIDDLNKFKTNLKSDDLQNAVEQTTAKVKAVQDYLQQREQQWKNAGNTIVSLAVGTAKKIAAA